MKKQADVDVQEKPPTLSIVYIYIYVYITHLSIDKLNRYMEIDKCYFFKLTKYKTYNGYLVISKNIRLHLMQVKLNLVKFKPFFS